MKQRKVYLFLIVGLLSALLFGAGLPSLTDAAPMIPPLPTLTPTPVPAPPVRGEAIELQAHFPSTWPWDKIHWQEPRTLVQWQDEKGKWHDVTGWLGAFDEIQLDRDGMVTGIKRWWVAEDDLGTGPFRWLVYVRADRPAVATSDPFDLPAATGQKVTVEVAITP